jgi:tetratricopeptide (TPR) repeat protein
MKTPSTDLFRIIHSMTSAEKRYFKKDTKDSNTSDLFDIINDQEEYDEDLVKKKLKDESFAKNLKVHKNRLQQILLKNLRAYHEEKTAQSKIKVLIENGEILLKKQLYDLAYAQLDKALKLCENYEEYELMLLILGIQARMASYFKEMLPAEETPMVQMEKCAAIIQNYVQHALISKKILHFLNSETADISVPEIFKYIYNLLQEEVENKGRDPLSPIAERMYLHSVALMYNAQGDFEKAYEHTKEILKRFEENEYIVKEKNAQYFNCIVNHLTFCARSNRLKELEQWVNKAQQHAKKNDHLMPNMIYVYNCFIEALRWAQNYPKIKAFVETDLEDLIQEYDLGEQFITKATLALAFEAYMALGENDKAGNILLQLLEKKQQLPKDMLYTFYIMELIYHFSQGDYMLIENMVAAHQKRLRRNNENLPFFEAAISFFKKVSTTAVFDQKTHFQLHKTALPKYEEDGIYFTLNQYFRYPVWLEANERKLDFGRLLETKKSVRF